MKKLNLIVTAILLATGAGSGQCDPRAGELDRLIDLIERHDKGMGSISVMHDGKEVYTRSYGYADRERGIRADAGTRYRIGSITKTFTASIIMKLVEEGRLSLSTPLADFYPEVPNAEIITVGQLLSHTSGLFNYTEAPDYLEWNTLPHTKEQVMARIVGGGIKFEPDQRQEYSNSNYLLITWIAEQVTGKSYPELLEEMITGPLGLRDTYVGGPVDPALGEAASYAKMWDRWVKEPETEMNIVLGAGYIVSTPYDINRFFQNLFAGNIVSPESLAAMSTVTHQFGMGLFNRQLQEVTLIGHTGGIDGFQAYAFSFPDRGISVAVLSNGAVYPVVRIMNAAMSQWLGLNWEMPEFPRPVNIPQAEREKYAGVYSCPELPFKITVSSTPEGLQGQATGQKVFPLVCYGDNRFEYESATVVMEFYPQQDKAIFTQHGRSLESERL